MAAPAAIQVPCPECRVTVPVPINVTSNFHVGAGLSVKLAPDMGPMAEHYALAHA